MSNAIELPATLDDSFADQRPLDQVLWVRCKLCGLVTGVPENLNLDDLAWHLDHECVYREEVQANAGKIGDAGHTLRSA